MLRIHCEGQPGHGSLLLDNTAGEKARIIINKLYELREQEKKKLEDDPNLTDSDVTTVNMSIMEVSVYCFCCHLGKFVCLFFFSGWRSK